MIIAAIGGGIYAFKKWQKLPEPEKKGFGIKAVLWGTAAVVLGLVMAEALLEATRPLEGVAVMLCGRPEFVRDMVHQFTEAGIPRERIIAEDFHFH